MLTSLAFIFLVGLAMGAICQKLKLPRIIGMLVTGIVLGPYVLDLLDPSILGISANLRKMALIIILLKAGLSLDLLDLKKAGRSAVMMAFVPASFEIAGYIVFAPMILGVSRVEAAVMGAVLGAVSPAVVVPRMVSLMEKKYGTKKAIPQMIKSLKWLLWRLKRKGKLMLMLCLLFWAIRRLTLLLPKRKTSQSKKITNKAITKRFHSCKLPQLLI